MIPMLFGMARYKLSKKEHVGTIPDRVDITVKPKSKYQRVKEELVYRYFQLTDKIPAIKQERDIMEAQRQIEFKEYCDIELSHRKTLWSFGKYTTLEALGIGFNKPHIRPSRPGHEFDGWKDVNMTVVMINNNLKDKQ